MCKSARLRIVNGRILGDSFGCLTCHTPNGSSVVDYMIVNEEFLDQLLYFKVLDFRGEVSDHCPISAAWKCNVSIIDKTYRNDCKNMPFPDKFKWDDISIFNYQKALKHEQVLSQIKKIEGMKLEYSTQSVNKVVTLLTDVYITAAEIGLRRVVKKTKHKRKKRWFDENLHELKKNVRLSSQQLKKFPNIPEIRGAFFKNLKIYNKERRHKARMFKKNMIDKLDNLRSREPKAYWKLLKLL